MAPQWVRAVRRLVLVFALITVVFIYTMVLNVIERPDGIRIAGLFILGSDSSEFAVDLRVEGLTTVKPPWQSPDGRGPLGWWIRGGSDRSLHVHGIR